MLFSTCETGARWCPDAHHCSQVEDQFAEFFRLNWTRPLTPRLHPEARAELQRKRGESMIQMEKGCQPSKFRAMGKKLGEGASKKLTCGQCGRHIFILPFIFLTWMLRGDQSYQTDFLFQLNLFTNLFQEHMQPSTRWRGCLSPMP